MLKQTSNNTNSIFLNKTILLFLRDRDNTFKVKPYTKICFISSNILRTSQQIVNHTNLNSKADSTSVLNKDRKDTPRFVAFWVQREKLGT
jgi:hypothetical protein